MITLFFTLFFNVWVHLYDRSIDFIYILYTYLILFELLVAPSNASAPQREFDSSCWVAGQGSQLPPGAVAGGQDGEELFVGRASHEGALIPGKIVGSHGVCYIAWGGQEHGKTDYEVNKILKL